MGREVADSKLSPLTTQERKEWPEEQYRPWAAIRVPGDLEP